MGNKQNCRSHGCHLFLLCPQQEAPACRQIQGKHSFVNGVGYRPTATCSLQANSGDVRLHWACRPRLIGPTLLLVSPFYYLKKRDTSLSYSPAQPIPPRRTRLAPRSPMPYASRRTRLVPRTPPVPHATCRPRFTLHSPAPASTSLHWAAPNR